MSLGTRLCLFVCSIALILGMGPVAGASAAGPTSLSISAPAAYADTETTVVVVLADDTGAPIVGASVAVERRQGGAWQPVATVTTDGAGRASLDQVVSRVTADNRVRASYAGDAEHPAATAEGGLPLVARPSQVAIAGPRSVVDGNLISVRVGWRTTNGTPVPGPVRVHRRIGGGPWRLVATVRTGADGRATLRARPRDDTQWQARARGMTWVKGDSSGVLRVDNRPPGRLVRLPQGAPRPRRTLPAQRFAVGSGANVRITAISDAMWAQMAGISWHRGCPVGRSALRVVRVNYWDYRGYRRRGELVANADAAGAMGAALAEMYQRKLPIRSLYRIDRFGWSKRLHGGDDYESMAAGNTSAFNCRDVVGRPGRRSPHSWGRSLDVNTWENPYRSARGTVPNTWWQSRSHPLVAWRSRSHQVVRLMARHGLRWTYGNGDTQHFDYVGGGGHGRIAAGSGPPPCARYCD